MTATTPAIVFGLKLNGVLWKEYSWVSQTGEIPQNFYDKIDANEDFDAEEYAQTEEFQRPILQEEADGYEHLEWCGFE